MGAKNIAKEKMVAPKVTREVYSMKVVGPWLSSATFDEESTLWNLGLQLGNIVVSKLLDRGEPLLNLRQPLYPQHDVDDRFAAQAIYGSAAYVLNCNIHSVE